MAGILNVRRGYLNFFMDDAGSFVLLSDYQKPWGMSLKLFIDSLTISRAS